MWLQRLVLRWRTILVAWGQIVKWMMRKVVVSLQRSLPYRGFVCVVSPCHTRFIISSFVSFARCLASILRYQYTRLVHSLALRYRLSSVLHANLVGHGSHQCARTSSPSPSQSDATPMHIYFHDEGSREKPFAYAHNMLTI